MSSMLCHSAIVDHAISILKKRRRPIQVSFYSYRKNVRYRFSQRAGNITEGTEFPFNVASGRDLPRTETVNKWKSLLQLQNVKL